MILQKFLSTKGEYIEENVDLSAGTLAWGTRAKKKAQEMENFVNATIGSATEDDGSLMICPSMIKEFKSLSGDQLFSYANVRGLEDFTKAWKEDTLESFPQHLINKTDRLSTLPVTACGGLTSGLMISSQLFFDKNDTFLVPNARWGNVDNVFFKNSQLKEETYTLLDKEGNLSLEDLVEKLKLLDKKEEKIGLYLNFPNNPSSISPSLEQIRNLHEILADISTPIIIIIDDAYEGYVYEESIIKHSIFPYLIGLNENILTLKIDGVSKRYCAYGARLGMITVGFGSEKEEEQKLQIRELIAKGNRTNTSSSPRGIQEVMKEILNDENKKRTLKEEKKRNLNILKQRYKLMKKLIEERESEFLTPVKFNSGFFSYFIAKEGHYATDISHKLLEKGLGTVPFVNKKNGLNGVRVAFCSISEEKIPQVIDLIYSL